MRALVLALGALGSCALPMEDHRSVPDAPPAIEVMAWNIWHGGREGGEEAGPRRVAEVIRASGADVVALQETYGSGPLLAEATGMHFHERGTNVSILSRFPVIEDISVSEEFRCAGALLERPGGERFAFYSIWLPYSAEIWAEGTRDVSDPAAMLAACRASEVALAEIRDGIEERLAGEAYRGVPVIVAGDFNSMSHLDHGDIGLGEYGVSVDWPTGHLLWDAGYVDAYREATPVIDRAADATWTPRFPEQEQDRIDFVFHRAPGWRTESARVLREHPEGFPSDHAAVVTRLRPGPAPDPAAPIDLSVATYNIKHGVGMDGTLDLARTTDAIRALDADIVALQEVDLGVGRSGGRNQVNELAGALGMHPAFSAFMPYGGGHYGMALLSRFPLADARSVRLPDGNEPRTCLSVRVRLPNGVDIQVVGVHLDWVTDDGLRFAQAEAVAAALAALDRPWLLLGDFNDVAGSRTLRLFDDGAERLAPKGATFPADAPARSIDFIFHSRPAEDAPRWEVLSTRVLDEPVASDHRPVRAALRLAR